MLCDPTSETIDATIYKADDWFVDVLDEHKARHMLCCEHIESVPNKFETCSPGCCKAHIEVSEGYDEVWAQICDGSED